MSTQSQEPQESQEFHELYRRHVQYVLDGNVEASLADMVQENIPQVFRGVIVPRGKVDSLRVVDIRREGATWVGETVYDTPDGRIGLRSVWESRDGSWKAAALENFPPEAGD
ncbi:hypothetical protein JL475_35415 [Streptomyces sp. M2CJ-2]|uniref:hypothetical protein n=1 Tax=Streptomyces sp. M2CJ-2 TaxID=2803948 RepID=UPI001925667C|nr:hypothetical protein [Streptomyces sp. M2CJ-2]MBL3671129.1 hypothetical protein [Streptomyces sp. M2CJ-2]